MTSLPLARAAVLICSSSHAVSARRVVGSRQGFGTRLAGLAVWSMRPSAMARLL
ncbi:MAG: hypothetical protein ACRDQ4_08115 [Pseudonocardiaceae bacterium]